MNETQTRHDLIDPALRAAGWGVVEGSRIRVEFPITQGRLIGQGRRAQPLKADYVLEYKNRRLAIIEAKARDKHYTDGLGQAKDYAERLNIRYTYCTNGLKIYGVDIEEGTEGDVSKFPGPDELWEMTYPMPKEDYKIEIEDWKDRFYTIPFEDRGGTWSPRYYQRNAIFKVLEAIAEKKQRILLTMATGTGKTATAFQICWKLFHAKWNLQRDGSRAPRILFLADRNILADQAFNAFNAFDKIDEYIKVRIRPSEIKKTGKVPTNGNVFFTIFQSFMTKVQDGANAEDDDAENTEEAISFNFGQYPSDFFDFIIIDECHRGGANDESSWRAIMEYFSPAVQLGLTATPKRDVNADTYEYFGEPVYTYALKDGINDGFLTPFRVKQIQTNYDEYTVTSDDHILSGEAEVGDTFTYEDYGRKVIVEQIERFRVKKYLREVDQPQKTLVFCATQQHAAIIRDIINQECDSENIHYCHRVTAEDGAQGEQHLRDFQDNEKSIPTVLTTSKKLSTGVDAPQIRNIVLLRPVNSMVEFKQIVGRGTRLSDSKDYFTIYDFVQAHQHFRDPEWDGEPSTPDIVVIDKERRCNICDQIKCVCDKPEPKPCTKCDNIPCVCEMPPKEMLTIRLANGKALELDATVKTTFWDPQGKPISATEFIQNLFGDLPTFFSDENTLREIWSRPSTRKKLLDELGEMGYNISQLDDLKKQIKGEDSDLYDVLIFIAYNKKLTPRRDRANRAIIKLGDYDPKQQEFLNFVLEQYIKEGVSELDMEKLSPLLHLKYNSITDAKNELGNIKSIRETFVDFQQYLYRESAG